MRNYLRLVEELVEDRDYYQEGEDGAIGHIATASPQEAWRIPVRTVPKRRHMGLIDVLIEHRNDSDLEEEESDEDGVITATGFSPAFAAKWASRLRGGIAQKWKRRVLAVRLHLASLFSFMVITMFVLEV